MANGRFFQFSLPGVEIPPNTSIVYQGKVVGRVIKRYDGTWFSAEITDPTFNALDPDMVKSISFKPRQKKGSS